jgi:membrane protein YdbS with pleckstrin-like domain
MARGSIVDDLTLIVLICFPLPPSPFRPSPFRLPPSPFRPYNCGQLFQPYPIEGDIAMRCPACGVEAVEQAIFCHKCGERLNAAGGESPRNHRPAGESASARANGFEPAAPTLREPHDQPEEQLWQGGYSPKAMTGAWLTSVLLSALLLVGGILWAPREARWWLILIVLMILPWVYHIAILCYRRMSVRYSLSTQRFIHERGILRRVNDRIEVLDMDDITFEQGLLERLSGVGTIRIASHDRTDPELLLPGIENVAQVAALFDNARLAERRRRGLHVEQI